ncbi:hypothetical protein QJQ45_028251 [Haematococcus lacustris]|nr:hypothetical protein QJQ45_028251 [Haematococcus lacustris]
MEDIKELVATALEQKRVLSRLKVELSAGLNQALRTLAPAASQSLHLLAVQAELRAHVFLAIDEQEKSNGNAGQEFLEWAGLEFTLKVYEPEIGPMPTFKGRSELGRQLLILIFVRCAGIAPLTSAARLSSLQPLSRSSLATLDPVQQHGSMPTQGPATVLEPPSKLAQGPAASAAGTQRKDSCHSRHGTHAVVPLCACLSYPLPLSEPAPIAAATSGAKPFPDQAHETAKPLAQAHGKATSAPSQPATKAATQTVVATAAAGCDESYADDAEVEVDDDFDDAEAVVEDDDEEDYATAMARKSSTPGPAPATATLPSQAGPSLASITGKPLPAPPSAAMPDHDELSDSGLSSSSFRPGRIRPPRHTAMRTTGSDGSRHEEARSHPGPTSSYARRMSDSGENLGVHSPGDSPGDRDRSLELNMSGDRSFGFSHELAGLAPPPFAASRDRQPGQRRASEDLSGGLSFDGELPAHPEDPDESANVPAGPPTASKLEPLAPLSQPSRGQLSKLTPLAPLGSVKGLSGSRSGPLGAAPPAMKSSQNSDDIKAELRKAGLLTIDSYSIHSSSSSADSSGDIDLPDNTTPTTSTGGAGPTAAGRQRRLSSTSGGGAAQSSSQVAAGKQGAGQGVPPHRSGTADGLRSVRGGVYDAEFSVNSQSLDLAAEVPEEDLDQGSSRSSLDELGIAGARAQAPQSHKYLASKGLSMDLRDTGLPGRDSRVALSMRPALYAHRL